MDATKIDHLFEDPGHTVRQGIMRLLHARTATLKGKERLYFVVDQTKSLNNSLILVKEVGGNILFKGTTLEVMHG